jgi:diacylglycerol kinase family enzyme
LNDNAQEFDGIIIAGGDGLINEVQNGNLSARRLPIAVVPSGMAVR